MFVTCLIFELEFSVQTKHVFYLISRCALVYRFFVHMVNYNLKHILPIQWWIKSKKWIYKL